MFPHLGYWLFSAFKVTVFCLGGYALGRQQTRIERLERQMARQRHLTRKLAEQEEDDFNESIANGRGDR